MLYPAERLVLAATALAVCNSQGGRGKSLAPICNGRIFRKYPLFSAPVRLEDLGYLLARAYGRGNVATLFALRSLALRDEPDTSSSLHGIRSVEGSGGP
jgi:hypothetical protein